MRQAFSLIRKLSARSVVQGSAAQWYLRVPTVSPSSSTRSHPSCNLSTTATSSSPQNEEDNEVIFHRNENNVATLTFNRPKKANAMGKLMLSQLQEILADLSSEKGDDVRCVVLTSCSDKVFSAGADLSERSKMSMEEASSFVSSLRDCFSSLGSLPMPLIASVEGAAFGGGLEIALTADMIVAGQNARFGLPETSLAIIPGAGGTQRLPRLIGESRAKELIYTARRLDAQTSYEYGIVQHLTAAGEADAKALSIAEEIAQNGPLAVRAAKMSISKGLEQTLVEGMEIEKQCYATIIPTQDRLEGLSAFQEKRKPEYKGC